ncbi:hypothetical protein B566_EDAN004234 [Ephemera danica]|nr:hypothetical protein B566_EDAN004234 [Ephemera danica]
MSRSAVIGCEADDWDNAPAKAVSDDAGVRAAVRRWAEFQNGQRIFLSTPSVLVGYRVEVYRAEGTTQWYTAVIVAYNEATSDLTVTDDTVLEEHNEDPRLVQMRLIGDGVVESIMRGENVGITPRRSRSAAANLALPPPVSTLHERYIHRRYYGYSTQKQTTIYFCCNHNCFERIKCRSPRVTAAPAPSPGSRGNHTPPSASSGSNSAGNSPGTTSRPHRAASRTPEVAAADKESPHI